MLIDRFGRPHDRLRISVTDRCNLRCTYCMPEDVQFLPREELLSFEEIAAFVRAAVPLGIRKLRLTGGEPLLRKQLPTLVQMLLAIPGVQDLGLTTNGLLLQAQAAGLYAAGLRRLNVSLDTLDPVHFRALARRDGLPQVLAGLAEAKRVGFANVKVNAVAIRGANDGDLVPLAHYCRAEGFEFRIIESMPIGADAWDRSALVDAEEILAKLEAGVAPLNPAPDQDPHSPAMDFVYADGRGRVGIIASVTRPFCKRCNRLRLTADGKLRNCLFALDETDVRAHLQAGDTAALQAAIAANVEAKWAGHEINSTRFVKPLRTMHAIGG
jgi:GTP 3',8-cyclase